jgi:serine/threonine-protein kinase
VNDVIPAPSVPLGTVIGGYRLDAVLGVGGMGTVFRATHVKLGRRAAIKVLADSLAADPTYVSRFFQEARVVNEVGHPNIIDIIDFIDLASPRRVAYVMELVEGPPLSRLLRTARLTVRQSLNISLQLLEALSAVHATKVVHRDLKPENILVVGSLETDLSAMGSIKVLDFGIAKVTGGSSEISHRTNTGMMLGTPAYMAPEQVAGEPVSSATDVYAVGELLFEMLSGKRLFGGANIAILRAKVSEEPPRIDLPADVPERARIAGLIRATVAQEQKARPKVPELAAALRGVLADVGEAGDIRPSEPPPIIPVALYQPTFSGQSHTSIRAPMKRRSIVLAASGLSLLLVACVVVVMVASRERLVVIDAVIPEEQPIEEVIEEQVEEAPVVEETEEPEKIEVAPPAKAATKKSAKKPKNSGPLKKGEFPTW